MKLSQTRAKIVDEFADKYIRVRGGHLEFADANMTFQSWIEEILSDYTKSIIEMVEVKEVPLPAPLTKEKVEAGKRIIMYNQALNDIKEELQK